MNCPHCHKPLPAALAAAALGAAGGAAGTGAAKRRDRAHYVAAARASAKVRAAKAKLKK